MSLRDAPLRVLKFGGSSVGRAHSLRQVLDIAARESMRGPIAMVVSAMGDSTDHLLRAVTLAADGDADGALQVVDGIEALANENARTVLSQLVSTSDASTHAATIATTVSEALQPLRRLLTGVSLVRERTAQSADAVIAFGELVSARVVRALLEARGVASVFVDAREWTVTDATFGTARVDLDASRTKLHALRATWGERVPVVTGFLGRTQDGRTTTLGRNGSDYTAALLAQLLAAAEVHIWTDVPGVMTADPALVDDAYPVAHLSQAEALELANLGFRMFHPRTMVPLTEAGIPLRIRNTLDPDAPGTLVSARGARDEKHPTCVVSLEDLALLNVDYTRETGRSDVGSRVLRALDKAGITVWMATQSPHGRALAAVLPQSQASRAEDAVREELAMELARSDVDAPQLQGPVSLVALVAGTMGQTPNVAGRFFGALGAVGVNVRASGQGASQRSIAAAIDGANTALAVRTVHAAFNLAHEQVSVLLMGKGVVGGALLGQLAAQSESLHRDHEIALRVVGLVDSERALFEPRGIDPSRYREALAAAPADRTSPDVLPLLDRLARLPVPVLVDCTALDGMDAVYAEALRRGIHVVSANKKPLTTPWATRESLMATARRHHREWRYETTVGASLPVIETLKNLVRTGDRVALIEGSLSGTLGYLANELMRGVPLSRAVRTARDLGYTEPHPRDDLSGLDAARKALILARELGLSLELTDVHLEPFIPRELLQADRLEDFYEALLAHDPVMAAQVEAFRREGKVLRYLARIDPHATGDTPRVRVAPVGVPNDHPASRLRGSEAFVGFTTQRYQDYPLLVQGAGAGGAVTAAGVLAELCAVAQTLRGR